MTPINKIINYLEPKIEYSRMEFLKYEWQWVMDQNMPLNLMLEIDLDRYQIKNLLY